MTEIVDSILQSSLVPETGHLRIVLGGAGGTQTLELTQAAAEALLLRITSQPRVPGRATAPANAITPIGCQPFESLQGLCGLAFNLGESGLHIGVPPNGIADVRKSLDIIEAIYRDRKMSRPT